MGNEDMMVQTTNETWHGWLRVLATHLVVWHHEVGSRSSQHEMAMPKCHKDG